MPRYSIYDVRDKISCYIDKKEEIFFHASKNWFFKLFKSSIIQRNKIGDLYHKQFFCSLCVSGGGGYEISKTKQREVHIIIALQFL